MRIAALLLMLFCASAIMAATPAPPAQEAKISADEIEVARTGEVLASGGVRIEYGLVTLTAEVVKLNRETLEFTASGKVCLELTDGTGSWTSSSVKGNLESRQFEFGPYRVDGQVWHGEGQGGQHTVNGQAIIQDAWMSTCDRLHPHYRIQAREITVHPDKTFTAKHVTLRLGNVPIFYFPWLWGDTEGMSSFIFRPGYSGKRGAYLRIGRIWRFATGADADVYLDLMTKRGIGVGSDSHYQSPDNEREWQSILYYLHDTDTPETSHGWNRRFKSTDDRFRVHAYLRDEQPSPFPGFDRMTIRLNLDYLSDIDMLEDWFQRDYRRQRQPRTYADATLEGDLGALGLSFRPRVNDFHTVVETLPELRHELPRITLPGDLLEYQTTSRIGYYSMKWRDFDRKRTDIFRDDWDLDPELLLDNADYHAFRAHTQHFLYAPLPLGDWATLTPRIGFAFTHYSRSSQTPVTQRDLADKLTLDNPDNTRSRKIIVNYDSDGGEVTRFAFETGAEWKTAFHSDWLDVKNPTLQLNGIRHVLEPYLQYTSMHAPSHSRDHLYWFDDRDRLQKQHFLRIGIDQRLLTRQDVGSRSFLRLQSYFDYHLDRDKEYDRYPGDLAGRFDYTPRDDFGAWGVLDYHVGDGAVHRGELGMRFGRTQDLHFNFRYIFRHEHLSRSAYSLGATLVDLTGESGYLKKDFESANSIRGELNIPINSITELGITTEYDFERGKLSEHMYELSRELHCWRLAFAIGWENESFETLLLLQLTAFPNVKIHLDL